MLLVKKCDNDKYSPDIQIYLQFLLVVFYFRVALEVDIKTLHPNSTAAKSRRARTTDYLNRPNAFALLTKVNSQRR